MQRAGTMSRLQCDADLAVSDLEMALEQVMTARGSRGITKIAEAIDHQTTWKNAPRPDTLADFADVALPFTQKAGRSMCERWLRALHH